jgi:mono/diheme cytochrome c family protein
MIAVVLCAACTSGAVPPDPVAGGDLYLAPHDDGNTFACGTCHALEEPASDFRRPAHPIGNATRRPSYKNGQTTSLLDAVNSCRQEWMAAPAFTADDARWQDLQAYLAEQAGAAADAVAPLSFVIADPPKDLTGGDPDTGHTTFNQTCAVCHGKDAAGTQRAPAIAGTKLTAEVVAERVRHSGSTTAEFYPGLTGGRMPFWAADRLSEDELRDILGYLAMTETVDLAPEDTGPDAIDLSVGGAQTGCGKTHPKVGQTMTMATHAHQVAGSATILDDCTIRFTGFSYDGGGIDVRMYSGKGGDYEHGAAVSTNIVGMAYGNAAVEIRLPAGVSLDEVDGLSVWCVTVSFSFGEGTFK